MPSGRTITSPTVAPERFDAIEESRKLIGLSKAEIARRLKVSQPSVVLWFNGKGRLSEERADQIEKVLVDYADQHLAYAPTTHVLVNKLLGRVVEWVAEDENKKSNREDP